MCHVTIERDSLLAIRKSVINSNSKLDQHTWNKLCKLKIANKTTRGCRAGRYKQRSIAVQITNRSQFSRSAPAAKCNKYNHSAKPKNPNCGGMVSLFGSRQPVPIFYPIDKTVTKMRLCHYTDSRLKKALRTVAIIVVMLNIRI